MGTRVRSRVRARVRVACIAHGVWVWDRATQPTPPQSQVGFKAEQPNPSRLQPGLKPKYPPWVKTWVSNPPPRWVTTWVKTHGLNPGLASTQPSFNPAQGQLGQPPGRLTGLKTLNPRVGYIRPRLWGGGQPFRPAMITERSRVTSAPQSLIGAPRDGRAGPPTRAFRGAPWPPRVTA